MRLQKKELEIARSVDGEKDWTDHVQQSISSYTSLKAARRRFANSLNNVDWRTYNLNDYFFTHCSIVASVAAEEDGFTIRPGSVNYINDNKNAWLNGVLGPDTNVFRSFRNAENYYEHFQVPAYSKGKILDAVLRKETNPDGDMIWVCDILVATNRKHKDIVSRIAKGNLTTMSMGCLANITQCSKCGKHIANDWQACQHIRHELGQTYTTKYGNKSKVAELCGVPGNKNSCVFIEASWVESPAFKGAVLNHYIDAPVKSNKTANSENGIRTLDFSWLNETNLNMLRNLKVANKTSMVALKMARQEIERAMINNNV